MGIFGSRFDDTDKRLHKASLVVNSVNTNGYSDFTFRRWINIYTINLGIQSAIDFPLEIINEVESIDNAGGTGVMNSFLNAARSGLYFASTTGQIYTFFNPIVTRVVRVYCITGTGAQAWATILYK